MKTLSVGNIATLPVASQYQAIQARVGRHIPCRARQAPDC